MTTAKLLYRSRTLALAPLAVSVLVACGGGGGGGTTGPHLGRIVVVPGSLTLLHGQSVHLVASVFDTSGAPVPGAVVAFHSNDPTLVTVSSTGDVLAVGDSGTGSVSATAAALVLTVRVVVTPPISTRIVATTPVAGAPYVGAISATGKVYVGTQSGPFLYGQLPAFTLTALGLGSEFENALVFTSFGGRAYLAVAGLVELSPTTNTVLRTIAPPDVTLPLDLAISPDGQQLYTSTAEPNLDIVDLSTLTVTSRIPTPAQMLHLVVHPTSLFVYGSIQGPSQIAEINLQDQTIRSLMMTPTPQGLAVSPDGGELYVANEDAQSLDVVTLATSVVTSFPLQCRGWGLAEAPDGKRLYVSCPQDHVIQVLDRVGRNILATLPTGGTPRRLAVSPDGKTVIVPNEAGWVDFIQ